MDANSTQAADSSSGAGPAGAQGTPAPSAPPTAEWPSAPAAGEYQPVADDPNNWDGSEPDETELPPAGLWQRMKADPEYAPEHLALEAITRLGPEASRWVQRTQARYPGMPADTVAQIAARRFVTFARLSGAAAGATGLPGAVIDVGVLAWTQARMVLHIAASYGVDPTEADRATDLLVLQGVHKYAQTARSALAVARGHETVDALLPAKGQSPQVTQVFLRLGWKLAQMAGLKAAKKMFAKMVPGAAIILGTWANSSATKDLAKKTVALYRNAAQHPYQLPAGPGQPQADQQIEPRARP
ncbi:EcsC family protein [Virgisporangium aurantiacum]|uniref:EcsC protein family protein n=1 Tax=Virgisporangium aurantiacum TaxID=175570 RepID=A0A8J4E428_9ACTN|nr:EcsC family protein [Virgisporangium aurantiacum]GIJ60568.1 hypothetical protein Vau01_080840 [Virgisporangium aurantiacum]